jgi:hypothetical protein
VVWVLQYRMSLVLEPALGSWRGLLVRDFGWSEYCASSRSMEGNNWSIGVIPDCKAGYAVGIEPCTCVTRAGKRSGERQTPHYAPRGLPLGPLLSRPEKKDMSFSLSILPSPCDVGGGGDVAPFSRLASRSCLDVSSESL